MCAAFLTRHRRDEAGLRGTRGSREAGDAAMRPGARYRLALRRSHNCYGRPNSVCPSVAIFLPYTASLCLGDRMLRIVLAVVAQLVVVGSVFAEPISLKGDKLREVLASFYLGDRHPPQDHHPGAGRPRWTRIGRSWCPRLNPRGCS